MLKTETLTSDASGIARAAAVLQAGGLVAFPSETVYGLGGDARNSTACARIYAAKGRPQFNPLIVHVASLNEAEKLIEFSDITRKLAKDFWPGPLTLVAPLRPNHGLSPLVSAGLDTVAIRVPAHPVAQALLQACGHPVAGPSANPSGRISPTRAAHVLQGLSGKIEAVLDGGACAVGLESTILGVDGETVTLLREGGLASEQIEAALGAPLHRASTPGKITAPGQLSSHYAPNAPVVLNVETAPGDSIHIGFGPGASDLSLSPSGDLICAAAALFDTLHQADALARNRGAKQITIAPIPEVGLGRAINDRLRRAAAPRA